MEPTVQSVTAESPDVFDLLAALWSGKWILLLSCAAFGMAGLLYAIYATKWYQADVVLLQSSNDQLGSGVSQFAGLASLAGINLNTASSSKESIAVLQSRDLAREFIKSHELLPTLEGFILRSRKGESASTSLDVRDAVRLFTEDILSIKEDAKRGVVVLSITWIDPVAAANWANAMAVQVNQRLQSRALAEAQRNINYLRSQLEGSASPFVQQALSKLLESEMQKLLVARGNGDFAFRIVDSAQVPKERARPKRVLICLLAVTAGLVLGGFIVLLRFFWLQRRRRSPAITGSAA
jgi:uncharacterized protein involved in exopolysaccharide biosynthesis